MKRSALLLTLVALVAAVGLTGAAAPASAGTAPGPTTCGGTVGAPHELPSGTYSSLLVTGVCAIELGPVTVTGDVDVDPGAALLSAYSAHGSQLTVGGSVAAASGASLILGCEPANFPCFDDPDPAHPSTSSTTTVGGSVTASDPLGVIVHHSTVADDVVATGGGGGVRCTPSPTTVFSLIPDNGEVVYSDYEDLSVGGNLRVTGLGSCWIGALRLTVAGSATFSDDSFADPDADEILNNHIGGNLLCTDLSPRVQFGDAGQAGSTVGGYGTGDCAFSRLLAYPGSKPVVYLPIATHDPTHRGYWLAASDGGIFAFGAPFYGAGTDGSRTIGGVAASPGGTGYQLASSSGSVLPFTRLGSDPCSGTLPALNQPIVGLAAAPSGDGCWLVASDGGVFGFGPQAPFFGSAGNLVLDRPVVGMASTANGDGYYLVASDGGIFSYGPGAVFQGSMGGQHLNQPIVGMAVDPSTGGYWLVAADGGIFSFGAPFLGSLGAQHLNKPIVGIAAAPGGDGYYLVASDGGVFTFGPGAVFQGSTGALTLNRPIIGLALG
jgi:hypothetical protein